MTENLPPSGSATPAPRSPRRNGALWLIGFGLLANAAVILYPHLTGHPAPDLRFDSAAFAQAAPAGQPLGARGIYMMPAQLGPSSYGLYLMDVDSGTICVYKALPDTSRFRLMAVRSFKYDRFLEDYDNEGLLPKDVQHMVNAQRQRQNLETETNQATVDQSPKPDEDAPDKK